MCLFKYFLDGQVREIYWLNKSRHLPLFFVINDSSNSFITSNCEDPMPSLVPKHLDTWQGH